MKKNVLVFGLISGLIISALMIIFMVINKCYENYELGMLLGYTSMILSFSFVFVGVKNFRDKYNDGLITFGKAFKVGILITLISCTFYVLTWLVEYYCFMPNFMNDYASHMIKSVQESGAGQAEIDATIAQMASFKEMYKSPIVVILMTYVEVLPVGLLFTILSALVFKKKAKVSVN